MSGASSPSEILASVKALVQEVLFLEMLASMLSLVQVPEVLAWVLHVLASALASAALAQVPVMVPVSIGQVAVPTSVQVPEVSAWVL